MSFQYAAGDDVTAIRMALAYLDMDVNECILVDHADTPATLVVRDSDDTTTMCVRGLRPILVYVTRRAHLLPSDPAHCALVWEWIELERDMAEALSRPWWVRAAAHLFLTADWQSVRAPLLRLEAELAQNVWLGGFEESTAADFCWIARLRWLHGRCEIPRSTYPRVRAYMERNPALTHEEEPEDEREEEPEDEREQEVSRDNEDTVAGEEMVGEELAGEAALVTAAEKKLV